MELNETAVSVRGLGFSYNGLPVLDDVNVDIYPGRMTVVLGRNGSGKSTFLRILAGLLKYDIGEVKIMGYENSHLTYRKRAELVGFLNQQHKPAFPFSVEEVVLTGRAGANSFFPDKEDVRATRHAMNITGIGDLSHRKYTDLSGGEQQLVMITRILAQNPRAIILDEPTSHLDLVHQTRLMRLLRNLTSEGLTVICVIHDPNLAFMNGDDFLFVKNKKIIRPPSGNPYDPEFLSSIYQVKIETVRYRGKSFVFTLNG